MNTLVSYLIMGFIIAAILYTFSQFQKLRTLRNKREKVMGGKRTSLPLLDKLFNKYAQKGYNIISRIPVLNTILIQIRKKLETLSVYDEYTLRKEVMKILYTVLLVVILAIMILVVVRPSFLIIFWVLIGILLLSGILIDFFVYRVELKLLTQLKEFNNRVRFTYQQTKMIDESFFEALQFVGPEMKVHAERINKILSSVNPEEELEKYEAVAPTRYLRVVAGLAVLVKERGDKFQEGKGSTFLLGLTEMNRELNNELLYRKRLTYALRSISTLAIIPIFFTIPVRNYSQSSFPTTSEFYTSRIGFFSEILIYMISIACYLIVRKMRDVSENREELNQKKLKWDDWLFKKVPLVKSVSIALSPKENTKKFFTLRQLIKDANEQFTVYQLTLRKIVIGLLASLILVGAFTYSHIRETNNILENAAVSSMFTNAFFVKEKALVEQQTEYDKKVIADLEKIEILPTREELTTMIAAQLGEEVSSENVNETVNRITHKWQVLNNSYLKWWEVLLSLIIGYTIAQIPIFVLQYKRKARLKMMEQEVYQLLVLVSVLKDFDGMSVSVILNWLERFSIAFKESLTIAIEEFDSGPEMALEKLSEKNTFEPFQQIVKRLSLTLERLSIVEAFSDIDVERNYYLEQRKEEQKREVGSKTRIADFLGLAPISALIFIYLVFPIMYVAVKGSQTMMELLK